METLGRCSANTTFVLPPSGQIHSFHPAAGESGTQRDWETWPIPQRWSVGDAEFKATWHWPKYTVFWIKPTGGDQDERWRKRWEEEWTLGQRESLPGVGGAHPADWYSQHHWLSNWPQQHHQFLSWYINHKLQTGTSLMWSHLATLTCWFERSSKILGRTDAQNIWDLSPSSASTSPLPYAHHFTQGVRGQDWHVCPGHLFIGWYLIPDLSHPPKPQWIQSCPINQQYKAGQGMEEWPQLVSTHFSCLGPVSTKREAGALLPWWKTELGVGETTDPHFDIETY